MKREKVSDNPQFQRRYEQNVRLLKEFPWLWGIRLQWAFVYDNISVAKADRTLRDLLNVEDKNPQFELWAYIARVCIQFEIVQIEPREHTPRLVERLQDYLWSRNNGNDLLHLVLVRRVEGDNVTCVNHTEARIYRPEDTTTPLMLSLL
jgi:hypothetical protein